MHFFTISPTLSTAARRRRGFDYPERMVRRDPNVTLGIRNARFARPAVLVALGVVLAGAFAWAATWRASPAPAPEARWRNGVIVAIRHCEDPAGEAAYLRCASLHCARRVSQLLTNAKQARLRIVSQTFASGGIRVTGAIDQYLRARTLPTGFVCDMRHMYDAQPQWVFGRRDVKEAEFRAGRARGAMRELQNADLFTPRPNDGRGAE